SLTNAQPADEGLYTVQVSNPKATLLSRSAKLVVAESPSPPNQPPVLPEQPARIVSALAELVVTNTATDPDGPANLLTYELVDPPAGATIDAEGFIRWTPSRTQGPGTNTLITVVTDNGVPNLSATNSFTVVVSAPLLAAPESWVVNVGQAVAFTNYATDNDPSKKLFFSLVSGPETAKITPESGIFNWRPSVEAAGTTNRIELRVTDDSTPALSDEKVFTIVVNPLEPAMVTPALLTGGQFRLRVNGPLGPDYVFEASPDLIEWIHLQTITPAAMPFDLTDINVNTSTNRFYRVRLGP
ncbi:MAG TPA: hypothetical protein VEC99_03570, partial [Clostridia bacterium]|nr:hypothetical protein [Clostridia bacterium]